MTAAAASISTSAFLPFTSCSTTALLALLYIWAFLTPRKGGFGEMMPRPEPPTCFLHLSKELALRNSQSSSYWMTLGNACGQGQSHQAQRCSSRFFMVVMWCWHHVYQCCMLLTPQLMTGGCSSSGTLASPLQSLLARSI